MKEPRRRHEHGQHRASQENAAPGPYLIGALGLNNGLLALEDPQDHTQVEEGADVAGHKGDHGRDDIPRGNDAFEDEEFPQEPGQRRNTG